MDPVTHVLAAVTVAEVLAVRTVGETAKVVAAVGGALAPDVDFISRRLGHIGLLKFHHTVTHSLVGGAVLASLWATAVWLLTRGSWLTLFGFAAAGLGTHIILDLILHNNGLMLFWPFAGRMVRGGLALGLNPLTSSARCGERRLTVCLLCQGYSVLLSRPFFLLAGTAAVGAVAWEWRRYVAVGGLSALTLYFGYVFVMKIIARRIGRRALAGKVKVFPASFGGRRWLVVKREGEGYATVTVDAWAGNSTPPRPHTLAAKAAISLTENLPAVAAFKAAAIIPFVEEGPSGEVRWVDLAYDFTPEVLLHALKIKLNDQGAPVFEEFRERW